MHLANENQIAEIESYWQHIEAYQAALDNVTKVIAGYIEAYEIVLASKDGRPQAGIETRYITSEGRDEEDWRGNLISATPGRKNVNLWLLTVTSSGGLPYGENESVGSFDKPRTIGVDYFYDWNYGLDFENSEDYFNRKLDGIDFVFEQIRTCLPDNAEIESWTFRRMIKQFTNSSTHVAKGDLAIKLRGL